MFFRAGRIVSRLASRPGRAFGAAFAFALLLSYAPPARAQIGTDSTGTGGRHTIQGRLVNPLGRRADARIRVKLESTSNLSGDLSVLADANGTFAFRGLTSGTYVIVIEADENYEAVREIVTIESDVSNPRRGVHIPVTPRPYTVQIYLKPKKGAGFEARPGVIDASLAAVPKPAVEHYNKAMEWARQKEHAKAAESLRAALALHSDFALAQSALGIQYLAMREPAKAAEALQAALKLSPNDYVTLVSYGFALIEQKQFARAEEPLRAAAVKNPALPQAHFHLGVALVRQRKLEEAEKSLRQAITSGISGEYLGLAHYYLGGVYWASQDYKRAINELETYLRLRPDLPAADRDRVRSTIKELRGKI